MTDIKSKEQRNKARKSPPKRCGFCSKKGHNRRTCETMRWMGRAGHLETYL